MATGRIGVTPTLRTRWSKAPAGGTTSLSGLDDNSVSLVYDVGYEGVYRNGVLLSRGNDYTATDGTTVTLIDATITGDIIEIFANELIPLSDAISKGQYTAKGALLSATAASTPGVLTVGANDQVLTADSSTATGLKWAAAGTSFVGCSLTKSANQSLSNNTSTAITFDGEKFDTSGFHDNTTNNSRITIPSGKAGYYLITGSLKFTSSTTGVRRADLNKNGTLIQFYFNQYPNTGSDWTGSSFASIENLAVGDYIELFGQQSSGGALNVVGGGDEATRIQVQYLGA